MVTQNQVRNVRDALIRFNVVLENDGDLTAASTAVSSINPIRGQASLFGNVRSFTPPALTLKNAEWPTMGDGQKKVDLGVEEMDFMLESASYSPGLRALYGKRIRATVRAGLWQEHSKRYDELVIECAGNVEETTGSQVAAGELPTGVSLKINCTRYVERLNGVTFIEIDIDRFIRRIDGADQLATLRQFLGVGQGENTGGNPPPNSRVSGTTPGVFPN